MAAALGCPHTICLYAGTYPGREWGATLETFASSWTELATTTTMTGWNWLCASGLYAK